MFSPKQKITAIILCAIFVILWLSPNTILVDSLLGEGKKWHVVGGYHNNVEATKILSELHTKIRLLLSKLDQKYCVNGKKSRRAFITRSIINNYHANRVYENDPKKIGKDTSYTVNKGEKMYICLRHRENNMKFADKNTILFVMLHEISHIGNFNGWGHKEDFWAVFKFMLVEATNEGVYNPIDYRATPVRYCGITIDYNPFFDSSTHIDF